MRTDNARMPRHSHTLETLPADDEPLVAVACQEKLRLRLRFASEARRFLQALNGYLALNGQATGARTQRKNTADEARKACELAMDALEAHRTSHRC